MYVKTSQQIYLRGNLLDRFVGDRWRRTGDAPARATLRSGYLRLDVPDGGAHVAQQIDIVADLQTNTLFASAGAMQIRFPGPTLYDNGDGTFAAPRPLRNDTSYSIDATPRLIGSRYAIDAAQPDARYLQIDPAISARVRELAESVTANAGDAWQKARALEDHLRSNYTYSYETVLPYQGHTPLDWFLFESRKGHCEFFASAMVVMLREIGIPARLANGFSLGERNPLTGYYEVRAMEGHAWAEAWIAGRGWVMFEPTPFYPLPQQQDTPQQQVADETDRYLERLADTSAQLSPQALRTELLQIARDAWSNARHLQHVLMGLAMRVLPRLPLVAALLALVWATWIAARLAWRDTRERREVARLLDQAQGDHGGTVLSLAQALELAYGSRGCARSAQRTLRQYCEMLLAQAVPLPEDFADAFDAARYGGGSAAYVAHCGAVATAIRARVAAQRYPRLQQLLQQWRAKLLRRRRIA
jgi:transglutaminase-like putative cysteine protease